LVVAPGDDRAIALEGESEVVPAEIATTPDWAAAGTSVW